MPSHNQIDLIEMPAADAATLAAARSFYEGAFGWRFTDYGEYLNTSDSGVVAGIPGGRRFRFADPAGNELAVWSDAEAPQ